GVFRSDAGFSNDIGHGPPPAFRVNGMPARENIQGPAASALIQRCRCAWPLSSSAISARMSVRRLISEPWCATSSCVQSLGLGRRAASSSMPLLTAVKSAYSSWSFAVRSIMLTQIEEGPTWGWAFETQRHDTTRQAPVYSGGGTNTIYALAEKIHGLLERAGSALRRHRACVVTRRRSGARPRRCPTHGAAIRGCRRDSCFARTRGEARARTHTSPA